MTSACPTLLITGHTGFTGRNLWLHLRACDARVRVVGFSSHLSREFPPGAQIAGDLLHARGVIEVLRDVRPDFIVHAAGRTPPADGDRLWAANVVTTANLLNAARCLHHPPRVVVIGSAAEYGPSCHPIGEAHPCQPVTPYGRTKLQQTRLAAAYGSTFGIPVMIARAFNLLGPGMSESLFAGTLCGQIARSLPGSHLHLGNLGGMRDFLDIRDAVAAYWLIALSGKPGEVYNVCSGTAVAVRELVHCALALAGKTAEVIHDGTRDTPGDVEFSCGDPGKLKALTGWQPRYSLSESLKDTLAWFRERT